MKSAPHHDVQRKDEPKQRERYRGCLQPRVAHDVAAPAPDVEPEAVEAEEDVTIVWEVSRG